ncbi:MAG: efflux transporter outer membrane subunit [Phycisphaerales bacterium]|nr:efflux transporter outer membrane subunit [Phycisphaerales bacterium]
MMKRACCILVVLGGCTVHPVHDRALPDVHVPLSWGDVPEGHPHPQQWWRAYGDPMLDQWIDEALAHNQSLRQAWARMAQARAQAGIAHAPLLPEVAVRSRNLSHTETDVRGVPGGSSGATSVIVGAGLSWEIDVWKRIANTAQAAQLTAQASAAQVHATALALTGQVADAWFTIRATSELLEVLDEQVAVSEALLQSVEYRYANGLGTALQVLQQRQQVEAARAMIPPAQATLGVSWNALATLVGRAPQSMPEGMVEDFLPEVPPFPSLGAPADLLVRRPDVRGAHHALAAADHAVAAAVADRLPALRLTIDGDLHASNFGGPIDMTTVAIGGSFFQPIFDANRRRFEVDRQEAAVQERLAAWTDTFLTATREVDDALEREQWQDALLIEIEKQIRIAQAQLAEAHLQYADGLAEYLDVINAVQVLQGLQRQHVEARRQRLVYRANLYLALGGDWMQDLEPPVNTRRVLSKEET